MEFVTRAALEAAGHYETAAENLERMMERFPFPAGGQPNDPAVAEEAIRLLRRASAAEESGVRVLRRLAGRLRENGTYLQ